MEYFRFIAWWWKKRSTEERVIVSFVLSVAFLIPTLFIFGIKAIVGYIAGLVIILLLIGMYHVGLAIKGQWIKYQDHKEFEAERILNRLRGTR